MAHELRWQQEGRIIFGRIYDDFNGPDIDLWSETMLEYLEAGRQPIHLVVDLNNLKRITVGLTELKMRQPYLSHPNLGQVVVINGPAIVQVFAQIIASLLNLEYKQVSSLQNALTYLHEQDSTLASSSP